MTSWTDAQRDSRRTWSQLERLFDWAANRSKPMPPSDLASIRAQVTENLDRLVERADALERAPLLLGVSEEEDGTKTVVFDMRDGTTQKFQTRVSWLDSSPTLPEPDSAELIGLQESYNDQVSLTENVMRRASDLEARIAELESILSRAESEIVRVREEAWAKEEEREAEVEIRAAQNRALFQSRAGEMQILLEDRDRLKMAYMTASRVIDESLPAIADLLSERTEEVAMLRGEIAELRDTQTP